MLELLTDSSRPIAINQTDWRQQLSLFDLQRSTTHPPPVVPVERQWPMDTNHLISIKERIQKSALTAPPNPWKKIGSFAVGSLRSIGFDKKSELLLVISSSGRGVINCQTAEKVARDYEENFDDEIFLEAEGIGPLAGVVIRVAGIYGGGLPRFTRDGWSIENVTLDWAIQDILLLAPGSLLTGEKYGKPFGFYKLFRDFEPITAGFSYTGKTLVIAVSSGIEVWGR